MSPIEERNSRIGSWAKKLAGRLESEVAGDSGERMLWLVRHLEQYLERWLGFARCGQVTIAASLDNETFFVVLAAVQVIENTLDQAGSTRPFPQEEWEGFCAALSRVHQTPNRPTVAQVSEAFEGFYRKLTDGEIGGELPRS